jgi:acyl-coenzyme A thioesterase PaaI-like protein
MLFDTVGPALATLEPDQFIATLEMATRFLRPARPGRLTARGRIVQRDGDIVFVDADLAGADCVIVATATATIRVVPLAAP